MHTILNDIDLNTIYQRVLRTSTDQPGFYYKDLGKDLDSYTFRQTMVEVKNGLSELCQMYTEFQLNYQWLGRFSHQSTSGFHRDSSTPHSVLMLGYEPTEIDSSVSLADYTKLIKEEGLAVEEYFGAKEEINGANKDYPIEDYATELLPFPKDHYRLVILNNSRSFEEETYGIFHRGEILQKDLSKDRILDSIMLTLCKKGTAEQYSDESVREFIQTDKVER
ncbi:hypothetical protein [Reichenbachiella versicolor]|uniref:hypothetical protein n=1 Tax=Reichenbachiella versicolor TaxID=1821036 RepID=UPI000D6EAF83|nr:hypothetical protein [Reichenbachiella versicolor]